MLSGFVMETEETERLQESFSFYPEHGYDLVEVFLYFYKENEELIDRYQKLRLGVVEDWAGVEKAIEGLTEIQADGTLEAYMGIEYHTAEFDFRGIKINQITFDDPA